MWSIDGWLFRHAMQVVCLQRYLNSFDVKGGPYDHLLWWTRDAVCPALSGWIRGLAVLQNRLLDLTALKIGSVFSCAGGSRNLGYPASLLQKRILQLYRGTTPRVRSRT